ncbi:hypothetical protein GTQ40_11390 [Flavobacteriaceae bacterium R38]|nr:hypothetical protein [Flavobacteriaceae bacterium R38]
MSSKSFVVTSFKVDTDKSEIFWEGERLTTYGHLLCSDSEYRFIVYFLGKQKELPSPAYIPEYNLGAIFVDVDEMYTYLSLANVEEPVYVYMNKDYPKWNGISINEPIKEEII